jgi:hypothetical protein
VPTIVAVARRILSCILQDELRDEQVSTFGENVNHVETFMSLLV